MRKVSSTGWFAISFTALRSLFFPALSVCALSTLLLTTGCSAPEEKDRADDTSTPRSESVSVAESTRLSSAILGEDREILIATPDGYRKSEAGYPVLYLLDGRQNLLHVLGSADVLTRTGAMPATIIVGIVGENRDRDYSTSAVEGIPTSGGGPRFLSFLEEELIPFIDRNYRTMPFKTLAGHSLGGSLVTYALISKTDLFDAHIIMSPALWWDDRELIARAATFFQNRTALSKAVFFGIGTEDGYEMRQDLRTLARIVTDANLTDLRWAHHEYDNEGHMSAPLRISYFGLQHVYADLRHPAALLENFSATAFLAHEKYIQEKYGAAAKQTGEAYVDLGFALMAEEKYADAIVVFKRNTQAYPDWHMNYAWLADALEKRGDRQAALDTYQRAFDLAIKNGDPASAQYRESIERIGRTPPEGG